MSVPGSIVSGSMLTASTGAASLSNISLTGASSQAKPTKAEGAAKQFEAMLINQMMKSARETGSSALGDDDEDSDGGPMRDMADQQFSQLLANNGGLGMAKMLVKGLNDGDRNANQ